jgi:hypothetical protein
MPAIRAIEREVAVTHAAFGSFLANFASAENTLMALAHNLPAWRLTSLKSCSTGRSVTSWPTSCAGQ